MKSKSIVVALLVATLGLSKENAQINLGEKAMGALQNGVASFMSVSYTHLDVYKRQVIEND